MNTACCWLFDLDNTLYPSDCGLFRAIDRRINLYLEEFFGIGGERADGVRREYFEKYGITLVGLMQERGVDPAHYLDFVHRVPVADYLRPNVRLRNILESIPASKSIFTNGSRRHSEAVTAALGVSGLFENVFDIAELGYVPKPDPRAYRTVLDRLGIPGDAAVLVEDLPRNLPPARDLGMTTILVGGNGGGDADFSIAALEDLPAILPALGP